MTTQSAFSSVPVEQPFRSKHIDPVMAVVVGTIMVILDSTVVNVAMPNLIEYFDTSVSTMHAIVVHGIPLALSAVNTAEQYLPKFEQKSVPALDVIGMVLPRSPSHRLPMP
ncbi:hypothetical protein ACFQI7_36980 [Paenibacillus allorhizosphaerae]|uniref:Multidrug efflux MFS transporter n=1 Tax=Paenibacillus allorhizosphaerae TaxID=2849866 RepID=A0ABM8VTV2_9BACL|nr:hypothetical protein [Paenibacillus allorhizosphaerae]CAG7658280.1 hypothetical protein PAECIP111802_07005 [Paenibacillus allorhizosphaerae]